MNLESRPQPMSLDVSYRLHNMSLLATFLVVLIHCYISSEKGTPIWWFTMLIGGGRFGTGGFARIAVPYFFATSGFLLAGHICERNWYMTELGKRLKSLLLPYFIFCGVSGMAIVMWAVLAKSRGISFCLLQNAFGLNLEALPPIIPLWYLRSLFVLAAVSPVLVRLANPIGLITLFSLYAFREVGVAKILGCTVLQSGFWDVTFSLLGAFFFTLGIYLRSNPIVLTRRLLPIILSTIGSLLCLVLYGWLEKAGSEWFRVFKFLAIPFSLAAAWLYCPSIQLPQYIYKFCFPVFVLHYIVLRPLYSIVGFEECLWIRLIVLLSAGLSIPIITTIVLRKFLPKCCVIVFGGR